MSIGFDPPEDVTREVLKVRELVRGELEALERTVDAIPDPQQAYRSPAFSKALKLGYEMGIPRLTIPAKLGGRGFDQVAYFMISEELSAGAPGLGSHLQSGVLGPNFIHIFGLRDKHPAYADYFDAFMADTTGVHASAWAATEPAVGSDMFSFGNPDISFGTIAQQAGADTGSPIRLNGVKSRFVSNGHLADMLLVMAGAGNETSGIAGSGAYLVPADTPGIVQGPPADKLGMRCLNQASIEFHDVEIPPVMRVIEPGPRYERTFNSIVAFGNTAVGMRTLGITRRAYEMALDYAKNRIQGGTPIVAHQLIRDKLFDAFASIEAARGLLLKSAWLIDTGRRDFQISVAARVNACRMAARIIPEMVQVMGGYGILRENGIEKLYRDVKMLAIADGTVERVMLYATEPWQA